MEKEIQELNYESYRDFSEYFSNVNNYTSLQFHRSIEFMYVIKGEKPYSLGETVGSLKSGELLIIPPLKPHSYVKTDANVYCNVLPVSYSDIWEETLKGKTPTDCVIKDKELALDIEKHLQKISNTTSALLKDGIYKYVLGVVFQSVKFTDSVEKKTVNFATEVLVYIDRNFDKNITLENISREFGYSKYYFSCLFNKYFNVNFKSFLNKVRVAKAKNMLKTASINEVYFKCGYNSLQSFFYNFKLLTGKTPKEYQKSTD